MKGLRVASVVVARNEEELIEATIQSLLDQTIEIMIVVVDDGSTNGTPEISRALGVPTLSLPFHRENYIGNPAIAIRYNIGLDYVRRYSPDFVLIMGGDQVLPPNYVEDLIEKMGGPGSDIVVASGSIQGQPSVAPRGSGRMVNVAFWEKINRMNYPVNPGWESWLISRAEMDGYEARYFEEPTSISRETRKGPGKMRSRGRGMYALGYHPYYAIARGVFIMLRRPLSGLAMIYGYLNHGGVQTLDTFDFTRRQQRKRLWSRIKEKLMGGP